MMRFVHMGLNPRGSTDGSHMTNQHLAACQYLLEEYLSKVCEDWWRYGAQNYVLWTAESLRGLAAGIASLPGFDTMYIFSTEIKSIEEIQTNGRMPEAFWNWLGKQR